MFLPFSLVDNSKWVQISSLKWWPARLCAGYYYFCSASLQERNAGVVQNGSWMAWVIYGMIIWSNLEWSSGVVIWSGYLEWFCGCLESLLVAGKLSLANERILSLSYEMTYPRD